MAVTATTRIRNANLLAQIEAVSCDGLDPLHTRESLVLMMKTIYKLAAQGVDDEEDEGDLDSDGDSPKR
jgi:hypothetical protein